LYSTASYQAGNLQFIGLAGNNLSACNFSAQNLSYAGLSYGTLTGANFKGANLNNASLIGSTLTNANFSNANVGGANFAFSTLLASQLYSTSSYQAGNLQRIGLAGDNLSGGDFSGQNLSGANLSSVTLYSGVAFPPMEWGGADLSNAKLSGATLTNANLSGVDMRGATGFSGSSSGAITADTILPDGTIEGLTLDTTYTNRPPILLVRNYSGATSIPVHVQQYMALSPSASLVLEFDGNPWGSTISFDSGIPVTLGGSLELDLVAGVSAAGLVGDTFQVFDWTGVNPSGRFAITNDLPAGYSWDTSQLYTTGDVTLVPEPSAIVLLVAGTAGLAGYRRRR